MPNQPFSQTFVGIVLAGLLVGVILWKITGRAPRSEPQNPSRQQDTQRSAPLEQPPIPTKLTDVEPPSRETPLSSPATAGASRAQDSPPAQQRKKPQVVVVAADECKSPWTTEIMLQELERTFAQSARVNTILRSELPQAVREQLAQSSLNLASVQEIAEGLNTHYVVIATCLEAKEVPVGVTGIEGFESSMLRVVVRMQLLDGEAGAVVDSQGFEANEYTRVLGGGSRDAAHAAYRGMVKRFASEFLRRIEQIIDDQHPR